MRRSFDQQLSKLWGREPFSILKKWEDSDFAANAPDFRVKLADQTFLPLYGRTIGVGAELDITLLTGMPEQKAVFEAGDLDNRIKRIVDGLSAPTQKGELLPNLESGSRWHCLLENDNAVAGLSAKLGVYLASNDPSESFAIIRVRPLAYRVDLGNMAMLF